MEAETDFAERAFLLATIDARRAKRLHTSWRLRIGAWPGPSMIRF
jgi:hypothetical protein